MKEVINGATTDDVYEYAAQKYGDVPEHLWLAFPLYSVFRRSDNKKWYAIIMDVPKSRLGLKGEERVDILDVKCDPFKRDALLPKKGFLPAYHLNRKNWITVLLDGTVDKDAVFELIDESYEIVKDKSKKSARRIATSRLVPVNPKYYDIEEAFAKDDTILWKQSSSVIAGDTIYLYIAAPYSCILYKCVAVETDIPHEYDDGKVHMNKVMKIKRLHTYDRDMFGIDELKRHGVISVRGPRSVPYGLRRELEIASE